MSRIAKELRVVYPKQVRRSRISVQHTHLVVVERWNDAAGSHWDLSKKTLCGVNAARYLEASETPVSCPRCLRMKEEWPDVHQ
jgi:hypothetical protein